MLRILPKIIPALIFWGIFAFVVLEIPYPESLTQANFQQISLFFASLFLALMITLNLFLKNIFLSLSTTLGLIFVIVLKALGSLNFVTGVLTFLAVGLLFSYFRKIKRSTNPLGLKNLTKQTKIPKLTHMH